MVSYTLRLSGHIYIDMFFSPSQLRRGGHMCRSLYPKIGRLFVSYQRVLKMKESQYLEIQGILLNINETSVLDVRKIITLTC